MLERENGEVVLLGEGYSVARYTTNICNCGDSQWRGNASFARIFSCTVAEIGLLTRSPGPWCGTVK
jgi:hypothetical protein